jgi:hypothetical protein
LPQITIEYMIMVPMLILQIFLFPMTASWIMNNWVDSRQTLALEETASHLGSSIQQVYSALNHDSISTGTVRSSLAISPFIEGYAYTGNASLRAAEANSSQFLDLTLRFMGGTIEATTSITLGSNVNWDADSEFMSNSTNANLVAVKMSNDTILMYLEGD